MITLTTLQVRTFNLKLLTRKKNFEKQKLVMSSRATLPLINKMHTTRN